MSQKVRTYVDASLAVFLLLGLGLLSASFVISSCAVDTEDTATNTTTGGDSGNTVGNTIDNGETGQNIDVEDFQISADENTEYQTYWSLDSNRDGVIDSFQKPCIATEGQWVQCIVDLDELDLWYHGVTLNAELPGNLCAFLGKERYHYAVAKVGSMPVKVRYVEDDDGVVDQDSVLYFYNYSGNVISGSGGYPPSAAYKSQIETAEDIICPWDYTNQLDEGKNCCDGDYTSYSGNSLSALEPEDKEWGGKIANCFNGPAFDDGLAIDEDTGLPNYIITEVVGSGFGEEYEIKAHKDAGDHSGVYWSNYFARADHTTSCGRHSYSSTATYTCPEPVNQAGGGHPFFRFDCLDHNLEVVARIDVLVREWNTKDQLLLGASGDPDVEGEEDSPFSHPGYTDYENLNDFCDWKDKASGACLDDTLTNCFSTNTIEWYPCLAVDSFR